ncbi:hypothetical protein [Pseudomonas entomophila]|nr:hypothetical protein [Pseudomonas entomophila]
MNKLEKFNTLLELVLNLIELCQWLWPFIVEAKRLAGCWIG